MYKATFNIVTTISIGIKQKWYGKPVPTEVQRKGQFEITGLTEQDSKDINLPICHKLVGLFTQSQVESVKIEKEGEPA